MRSFLLVGHLERLGVTDSWAIMIASEERESWTKTHSWCTIRSYLSIEWYILHWSFPPLMVIYRREWVQRPACMHVRLLLSAPSGCCVEKKLDPTFFYSARFWRHFSPPFPFFFFSLVLFLIFFCQNMSHWCFGWLPVLSLFCGPVFFSSDSSLLGLWLYHFGWKSGIRRWKEISLRSDIWEAVWSIARVKLFPCPFCCYLFL
jgi:hypothetical protein